MRVLVLDNYDSFVFNLVQYLGELGADPIVHRNDALDVAAAVALEPDGVLVSPGPGRPEDAGIICDAVTAFAERGTPVLGVCLGHQAIGHVYGATIVGATELMHGKTSPIDHDGAGVFAGLPSPLTATRYHSLTIDPGTAARRPRGHGDRRADGTIMGVRHRHLDVEGVQFHPESVLTAAGHDLLRNFLARCALERCSRPRYRSHVRPNVGASRTNARRQPSRSMIVALAMPPPSHIVCRPKRPPVRSSSLSSVVIRRAPEQPSG